MKKVKVVILLGAPGSGKGTQAKILNQENANWLQISTGDLFRKEIASQSALGQELAQTLAAGQLVPDEKTNQVFESQVKQLLSSRPQTEALLLDGYPRTAPQVQALLAFCEREAQLEKPEAVEMEVDSELLVERLSGRLISKSGKIYHKIYNPPQREGVCDVDGSALIQRSDDQPTVIRERYKIYASQRDGIFRALEAANCRVQKIDGEGKPETVTMALKRAIASGGA